MLSSMDNPNIPDFLNVGIKQKYFIQRNEELK